MGCGEACDGARLDACSLDGRRQGCGRGCHELGANLVGEWVGLGCSISIGRGVREACCFRVAPRVDAVRISDLGWVAEVLETFGALDRGGAQFAGALLAGLNFNGHDVFRLENRRTCWGSGEDHVAWLERHLLGEVGNDLTEGEQQLLRGGVLDGFAVELGDDAQVHRVKVFGRDHDWAKWRVAVAGLRADVGALVCVLDVLDSDVVGCGDPADVRPAFVRGDAAGFLADHERDLAFELQQFGVRRAFNGLAGQGERGRRLHEVGRVFGGTAALFGAG